MRDIEIIKRELPIELLEFFYLTPLPGSQDHKELLEQGVAMDEKTKGVTSQYSRAEKQVRGVGRPFLCILHSRHLYIHVRQMRKLRKPSTSYEFS